MRIEAYAVIKGEIEVITGLRIGGSQQHMEIGGIENVVIRNPEDGMPYIPGSSLKGKMRSLLEWKHSIVDKYNGAPCKCGEQGCLVCRIFGTSAENAELGPTRLLVRDAFLSKAKPFLAKLEAKNLTFADIVEEKSENTINRLKAEATPRTMERVIPGTKFSFEMVYRCFSIPGLEPADKALVKHVIDALDLVEKDYLGGSGSRGYGQVQFYIETTPEAKKRPYEILQLKQNDFEKIFQWQTISTN